jgi:hypothetical protein
MSDCICDLGNECQCEHMTDAQRVEQCAHWHLPCPRILEQGRSSYLTDLRDRGNAEQMQRIGSDTSKARPKLNYSRNQRNIKDS